MGYNGEFEKGSGSNQLEHTRYFSRQLITADDLSQDQNYYREKQRMHNRLLHGYGIVCGLEVTPASTNAAPLNLRIGRGYALSDPGDDVYLHADIYVDLAKFIAGPKKEDCSRPCGPSILGHVDPENPFYIAIKYAECPARPVRVPPVGCGCDDTACEYSRIRDSFEIRCLAQLPNSHIPPASEIPFVCEALSSKVVPCPSQPKDPWIVLAGITIPASGNLTTTDIDPSVRRILLSSAILQEQLRTQCD